MVVGGGQLHQLGGSREVSRGEERDQWRRVEVRQGLWGWGARG